MRKYVALLLLAATLLSAQPPRTVPLPRNDYLTFIHPDAEAVIGFDVKPVAALLDEIMNSMPGAAHVTRTLTRTSEGLKELDRVWISTRGSSRHDDLALMTGHFERGVLAAEILKSPGMARVFLGGPNVMLAGSETAIKGALIRLNSATAKVGWAAEEARDLSTDHDFWVVMQPSADLLKTAARFEGIRQLSLGAKLHDEASLDGELVVDSPARIDKILVEIEEGKARASKDNPKARAALDDLILERDGNSLLFSANGGTLSPKQFAAELGKQMQALFNSGAAPPVVEQKPVVAEDKLQSVRKGMTRDEVVGLVGKPQSVTSISGLEAPRETWIYQLATGRKVTLRLDNGVVTSGPMF